MFGSGIHCIQGMVVFRCGSKLPAKYLNCQREATVYL